MSLNKKPPIAISMGEPGGINIEIISQCVKKDLPDFFLISDPKWVEKCLQELNLRIKVNVLENI